jgi:quercetin dioxygenase-like cupin family protein
MENAITAPDIYRPIRMGSEVFHPMRPDSYRDRNIFVMDWTMQARGFVPPHKHIHMDEHFKITKGVITFSVKGKKFIKTVGDELFIPNGTPHSIRNKTNDEIGITVTYTPCADTHRMFEIFVALNGADDKTMMTTIKYFYLYPKLNFREFSAPHPHFANIFLKSAINIYGKFKGWINCLM